jgi:circadian clock protein KaiC
VSNRQRVVIRKLATGVPGLDDVLGGGVPEYSFNLIAGAPGTGKTTLAQQILFANATPDRPGLFFTVLGEPAVKMLRYQQQFAFFDAARVGRDVHFLNLSDEVLNQSLDVILERVSADIERVHPAIVVVDSFRTVVRAADLRRVTNELELQHFVQRLALRLTSWEATSFLIGEFGDGESRDPVFTVADGVLWLENEVERNSTVRKLRVTKVRGQAALPGLHTLVISDAGLHVYPRLPKRPLARPATKRLKRRLSTGVSGLDAMMGGGIPEGDSLLVAGPTGSGKTILGTQFIAEGTRRGESAVIAVFEEHPGAYVARAGQLGFDLDEMIATGKLKILYLEPLDLSVDETLHTLSDLVQRYGATRVVIDSISGFEAALAPTFRQDFRASFYRLLVSLTGLGVTILSTVEVTESSDYLRFSPYNISFLTDDIIAMRYVELDGELRNVLAVVKMRGSDHSRELRSYAVTQHGLEIREAMTDYRGTITGVPERRTEPSELAHAELTATEAMVLDAILRLGETSAENVSSETGLPVERIRRAIEQLRAVGYVRAVERGQTTLYHASARSLR